VPTGAIAHRNNHHYPKKCPCCECDNETNDHVLLCPAISRQRWRTKCRKTVIHYMESTLNSDPVLCNILRDGMTRWATQLPAPDPTTYPDQYQELIRSQNYIGWDHLFPARWSSQWSILHSNYAQRVGLDPKLASGSAWVRIEGRSYNNGSTFGKSGTRKDTARTSSNKKQFAEPF
jgi:hypothetical protein